MATVRRDVSPCAEEGALINDDLNALPPQQKCPILPPSALGERRGSTFVAANRTAQRRRDASDAGFYYYASHPGQRTDRSYERMKEKERAAITHPTRRKSQKRVG